MKLVLSFVLVCFFSGTATAGHWTTEQLEVVDNLRRIYKTVFQAIEQNNFDLFAQNAPHHKESYIWFVDQAPVPSKGVEFEKEAIPNALYRRFFKNANLLEIRPIEITIDDDVALIHSFVTIIRETASGEPAFTGFKRFDAFRKKEGNGFS